MKSLIFMCILATSLFADNIGGVEYELPNASQFWKLNNQTEGGASNTFLYVPSGVVNSTEFFAASAINSVIDVNDLNSLQHSFKKLYPNMVMEINVIDKKDGDMTYEWSGKEQGVERMHGWGRAIRTEDGTVLLTYQTQNVGDIKALKDKWLPVFKNAKIQKPVTPTPQIK